MTKEGRGGNFVKEWGNRTDGGMRDGKDKGSKGGVAMTEVVGSTGEEGGSGINRGRKKGEVAMTERKGEWE